MSDLDFEELDAAVNELVNDQPETTDSAEPTKAAASSETSKIQKPPSSTQQTASIEPSSERHFRGQFMDMVHPSSDVSVTDKPNYAASRPVKVVAPTPSEEEMPFESETDAAQENLAEELAEVFAPDDEPIQEPQLDAADDSAAVDDAPKFEEENVAVAEETPDDAQELDLVEETVEVAETVDPYESPFLPDAKVEKRPLGTMPPTPLLPADDSGRGELEPQLSESNFITAFIEELKDGEASSDTDPNSDPDATTSPDTEEPAKLSSHSTASATDHLPRSNAKHAPTHDTRAALANTMIMPQYKASETAQLTQPQSPYTAAAETASKTDHKRHTPVWLWLLIYLLLMIAGGAAGAWLYLSGWLD